MINMKLRLTFFMLFFRAIKSSGRQEDDKDNISIPSASC